MVSLTIDHHKPSSTIINQIYHHKSPQIIINYQKWTLMDMDRILMDMGFIKQATVCHGPQASNQDTRSLPRSKRDKR